MAGRDTKTKFQGVFARHQGHCALTHELELSEKERGKAKCDCKPSYFGVVWDKKTGRPRKTRHYPKAIEARNARADLAASLRVGRPVGSSGMRFEQAAEKFVKAADEGIVLNKHGRRYRDGAVTDLRSSLAKVPADLRSRRLDELGRGDLQRMVDDFHGEGLSGSRIRSVVNSIRALYRWAIAREYTTANPAAEIHLPAMDAEPRERVVTPSELGELLAPLTESDQVAFALAAYSSARAAEIRGLTWPDVDLKRGAIRLAGQGGKSAAARRIVPLVKPLAAALRAAHLRQGRPAKGRVCPPLKASRSGEIATGQLLKRARKAWDNPNKAERKAAKKEGREPNLLIPIDLQGCRHSCATWLDHAGISPKVASQWMGHSTPERQPGAAAITLSRYTHILSGELEIARDQLDTFLEQRTTLQEIK